MQRINNITFDINHVKADDIFICAVGYEERSRFLLDKIDKRINHENIMILYFEDVKQRKEISAYINQKEASSINAFQGKYDKGDEVCDNVVLFLQKVTKPRGNIYVDYSAMPRSWYSKLPFKISNCLSTEVFFLYVVGEYPCDYKAYPGAGIDSYSLIGRPSLRTKKRLHVIGVGYDYVRTEALLSILDPDMYAVCSAHYSKDDEMERNVHEVNRKVMERAVSKMSFLTDDFAFLVARLCEVANEYLPLGDVVFVPDGPKPLIMAMALATQILNKEGVICMLVSRNIDCFVPLDVRATDNVLCFSYINRVPSQNEDNNIV